MYRGSYRLGILTLAALLLAAALALAGCGSQQQPRHLTPLPPHVQVLGSSFVVAPGWDALDLVLCQPADGGLQPTYHAAPLRDGSSLVICNAGPNAFSYPSSRRYAPRAERR